MKPTFRWALLSFGILGLLAWLTLDGIARTVCLIFLAGLVLKTLIAYKAGW
jgi:hypothetical protein